MIDLVSTIILILGVADDLRSRKIHNLLLSGLLLLSAAFVFAFRGWSGLGFGLLSGGTALLLMLPLVYMGAIGGGDMKLFAVFGFTSDPTSVGLVFIYSLVAGAAIGLVKAALSGKLMGVVQNTVHLAGNTGVKPTGENNIPYSVALLFGWVVHLSITEGWV